MSENLPFIWRKYYRNEAASSEKVLETVHEQVRQYLSRAATAAWRSTRYVRNVLFENRTRLTSEN
jgi:hypothetical protein